MGEFTRDGERNGYRARIHGLSVLERKHIHFKYIFHRL